MLILRLALKFPLKSIKSCSSPVLLQAISRRCQMWKFGIHWKTDDYLEILVELSEDMQDVRVKIKWNEDSPQSIKAMMKLRSSIIKTIFCLHQEYCSSLEVGEFLELPYASWDSESHHQFAMQDIVCSICLKKESVLSSDTTGSEVKRLDKILLHEPLVNLPQTILLKIFLCCNTDLLIEPDLLKQLNQSLKPHIAFACEQTFSTVQSHIEKHSLFCERTIVRTVLEEHEEEIKLNIEEEQLLLDPPIKIYGITYDPDDLPNGPLDSSHFRIIFNFLKNFNNWFELGIHLGLMPSALKEIENDFQRQERRCKIEMIQLWLDGSDASKSSLMEALKRSCLTLIQ
ncbi:PREDICTED: uncharacterized protein LOC109591723 [Amphimedon queenslandica]|uniref:Death domain-containing protein n=2 Tax=Amphimedon queenslandica TaxID=400682 RepID=A0AAN0K0D0_AMPQE|nr:PREDICTED: uncharacterized protein LOC109591723 [Amphimedon queenslandica]|eukprot:XP_019862947.1 PREDICTED: uncharacterized protein LOC109591723 [Amphimedon queenslandica]